MFELSLNNGYDRQVNTYCSLFTALSVYADPVICTVICTVQDIQE